MKHRKIVFVCTGNTCRSPMAEAVLKSELKKRKIRWYRVQSAGLRTEDGYTMSENSMQAMCEAGIPFASDFKSTKLTEKIVSEAHAVVCMTADQHLMLRGFSNVTSFPELCGKEIPDPYGQGIEVYRATLRAIRECMPRVIEICCPKVED